MIKISERLKTLGQYINPDETMADIGTDHGFLPVYLAQNKLCRGAVLTDVSKASLEKGRKNVIANFPELLLNSTSLSTGFNFDFRVGDGLTVLEKGEVDVVVIAGMGGILMTDILGEDPVKTASYKLFVLQPRTAVGKLRLWLSETGFVEEDYQLVKEGRFICEVLAVKPAIELLKTDEIVLNNIADKIKISKDKMENFDDNIENYMKYEVPERDTLVNTALGREFLKRKLRQEQNILAKLRSANISNFELQVEGRIDPNSKKKLIEQRIDYLKKLIEFGN